MQTFADLPASEARPSSHRSFVRGGWFCGPQMNNWMVIEKWLHLILCPQESQEESGLRQPSVSHVLKASTTCFLQSVSSVSMHWELSLVVAKTSQSAVLHFGPRQAKYYVLLHVSLASRHFILRLRPISNSLQLLDMDEPRCVMRGSCGKKGLFGKPLPCPYNGPPHQVSVTES
jgi:hypothetical protein